MPPVKRRTYTSYGGTPGIRKYVRVAIKRHETYAAEKRLFSSYSSASLVQGDLLVSNILSSISQGDAANNRQSRSILLDEVEIHWQVYGASGLSGSAPVLNLYWFWCGEALSGAPTTALSTITNAGQNTSKLLPLVGTVNTNNGAQNLAIDTLRATCIKHEKYALQYQFTGGEPVCAGVMKKKFKGRKSMFTSDSTGYQEGKNLYFVATMSNEASTISSTTVGNFAVNFVVKYHE